MSRVFSFLHLEYSCWSDGDCMFASLRTALVSHVAAPLQESVEPQSRVRFLHIRVMLVTVQVKNGGPPWGLKWHLIMVGLALP